MDEFRLSRKAEEGREADYRKEVSGVKAWDSRDFDSIANLLSFTALDLLGDDMHIMAFRRKPFGKIAEEDFSTADMRRIEVKAEENSHYELEV